MGGAEKKKKKKKVEKIEKMEAEDGGGGAADQAHEEDAPKNDEAEVDEAKKSRGLGKTGADGGEEFVESVAEAVGVLGGPAAVGDAPEAGALGCRGGGVPSPDVAEEAPSLSEEHLEELSEAWAIAAEVWRPKVEALPLEPFKVTTPEQEKIRVSATVKNGILLIRFVHAQTQVFQIQVKEEQKPAAVAASAKMCVLLADGVLPPAHKQRIMEVKGKFLQDALAGDDDKPNSSKWGLGALERS